MSTPSTLSPDQQLRRATAMAWAAVGLVIGAVGGLILAGFVGLMIGAILLTVGFGAIEEAVGARSLGKRLMGGAVVGQDGVGAPGWRHLLRNLFKGLVMLSPLLALPAVVSRRGVGVPETITRTLVVRG